MDFFTADLCDEYQERVQVLDPIFKSYAKIEKFSGKIVTIELNEDNSGLIELLKEKGQDRVIVVDVKGEKCAVVGENLVKLAKANGWRGIIINGYVRDIEYTTKAKIGLMAIGTYPKKSIKKSTSIRDIELNFANVKFIPNSTIYVDKDGIVLME